jgi:hypothetical protein
MGCQPHQHRAAIGRVARAQIKNELVAGFRDRLWVREWPLRLWDFTKHYQYIGGAGGEGVGYAAPAAVGAALANKKHGRISVAIQPDGDLMVANGVLWTAAHHRIPLLILMHNNRAYHQEVMGLQGLANRYNRGIDNIGIGTISTPSSTTQGGRAGVRRGPISDPKLLAAAIARHGSREARRSISDRHGHAARRHHEAVCWYSFPQRRWRQRPASTRTTASAVREKRLLWVPRHRGRRTGPRLAAASVAGGCSDGVCAAGTRMPPFS